MTDFYRGKRVVVTGGAGMVGAALVRLLIDAGATVAVIDDLSRGQNCVGPATFVKRDAANIEADAVYFSDAFAVFNLAAYVAGVLYNQAHHAEMFNNNIHLQVAPVIAAAQVQVPHFLQVSSVCVYAEDKQNPCREIGGVGGEPNEANAGYAWAKRMGERAAGWADLPHVVIVRPANIYGLYDYFDERAHVIPALIRKAVHDEAICVNGTGQEVREFLYADDAARGMLVALERGENGGIYNIGTDGENSTTIAELAYTIRELVGVDKAVQFTGGEGGDSRRIVNGDRLMRLGWRAQVNLADGLKHVCEWYKAR